MSLDLNDNQDKKKKKGKVKTNFKAGTLMGRIVSVIDTGLQHQTMWDGKQSRHLFWKPSEEQVQGQNNQTYVDTGEPVLNTIIKISVEFSTVRAINEEGEDVGPAVLSKNYNVRSKDLAQLAATLGTTYVGDLAGQAVMCPIGFTSGGNAKIASIAAAPEGIAVPELTNPAKVFDFKKPSLDVFNSLYTWQQDEIKQAVNFEGSVLDTLLKGREYEAGAKADAMTPNPDSGIDFDQDILF